MFRTLRERLRNVLMAPVRMLDVAEPMLRDVTQRLGLPAWSLIIAATWMTSFSIIFQAQVSDAIGTTSWVAWERTFASALLLVGAVTAYYSEGGSGGNLAAKPSRA